MLLFKSIIQPTLHLVQTLSVVAQASQFVGVVQTDRLQVLSVASTIQPVLQVEQTVSVVKQFRQFAGVQSDRLQVSSFLSRVQPVLHLVQILSIMAQAAQFVGVVQTDRLQVLPGVSFSKPLSQVSHTLVFEQVAQLLMLGH